MMHRIESLLAARRDPSSLYHQPPLQFRAWHERQLYQDRSTKKLIYLDLNFWINFRDALNASLPGKAAVTARQQAYLKIHSLLSRLIRNGRVSCVLSSSLLEEMAKMPKERQYLTSYVMDGLQCRTVLNNYRIGIAELVNVSNIVAGQPHYETYYLTSIFEANPILSDRFFEKFKSEDNFYQNALYIETLQYSVEQAIRESTWQPNYGPSELANNFNALKYSETVASYPQVVVEGLQSQLFMMGRLFPTTFSSIANLTVAHHIKEFKAVAPFQYLLASIFAAIAVDKNRKVQANDFYDAMQSCVAIPYADFLFTEKSFKHLVTSKPIEQLGSYHAVVESDLGKIIKLLDGIADGIHV